MSLEDVECFLIKKAMTRFDGNGRRGVEMIVAVVIVPVTRSLPEPPGV